MVLTLVTLSICNCVYWVDSSRYTISLSVCIIYLVTVVSWVIFTIRGIFWHSVLVKAQDWEALKLLEITSVSKSWFGIF